MGIEPKREVPGAGEALVDLATELLTEAVEIVHLAEQCRRSFCPTPMPAAPEAAPDERA